MFSCFKSKWIKLCTIAILFPTTLTLGQSQTYSLSSLIDSAQKYLPVLRQKRAIVDAAKLNIVDTRHSFLPQLRFGEQLDLGSANSVAGSFFGFGITPSTSGGIRADNTLQTVASNVAVLYSEYELIDFGLKSAKVNAAEAYENVAEADFQKELYLIVLNISRLYFNILKNQARLMADKQNIERYQDIYNVIQSLTLSGLRAGADSSMAKAELSKTRISYNQTLGTINQLKEQLSYLTGIASSQLTIDTLALNTLNHQPIIAPFIPDTVSNPIISYYSKRKELFLTNESVIRKSYLPKILLAGSSWARGSSIRYNDQYKPLISGLSYQRFNYAVGVAFTYNLFNSLYRKDKLAVNRYQLMASDFELQQQKLALRSAALQSDIALQTIHSNLIELPEQLQSATATYEQKLAQYRAGLISLIDLTNASFVLYRSQTDYIEALNDMYLSQLDKAASTGNLYAYLKTIK